MGDGPAHLGYNALLILKGVHDLSICVVGGREVDDGRGQSVVVHLPHVALKFGW